MRRMISALAATLLVAAPAAAGPKLSPEAQLAKEVEGRVAGEPVNCINLSRVRSSRIIDRTAIVYDAGGVIYVNRPRSGAHTLDDWDVMVTRLYGSQLCSVDVVDLYDSGARMPNGFILLGDFVPYRRVR